MVVPLFPLESIILLECMLLVDVAEVEDTAGAITEKVIFTNFIVYFIEACTNNYD